MNSNLNRGVWKKLENGWAKSLQEGKTVKVKIEPLYEGTDIRPYKFRVSYSIDNKGTSYRELYNKASK